jgi:hypothetical protein
MRRKLTTREKAKGIRKALKSRKTPRWLKPAMLRYLRELEREYRGEPS